MNFANHSDGRFKIGETVDVTRNAFDGNGTLEDTALTLDELRTKIPLTDDESKALKLLTHDERIPYLDYVAAIKSNPLARRVKVADLKHNSDLTRINNPSPKDFARVEKYRAALKFLNS